MSITNNLSDLSARSQGKNQWQGQTAGAVYRPELSAVSTARTNPHTPKSLLGWAMNSLDSWGFSRPGD